MKQTQLIDSLQSIGLTRKESDVYLTLLDIGSTTTGELIKKSSVSRSKVYDVLERLKQKGFVTEVTSNGIRNFSATSPTRIEEYLKKQKVELDQKIEDSKKVILQINKFAQTQAMQEAQVFDGIEGLKSYYNGILSNMSKNDEYLAITIANTHWSDEIRLFFQSFHLKRGEIGCKAKILYCENEREIVKSANLSKTRFYELRITKERVPSGIVIFKDSVATLLWNKKPTLFVIYSKELAKQYTEFFSQLWAKSKKN